MWKNFIKREEALLLIIVSGKIIISYQGHLNLKRY